jgi:hypothetical protein
MRSIFKVLCVCATLLLAACEIEDDLRLTSNGSGTYQMKISVEKQLTQALVELRKELEKEGYKIVQDGETPDRRFLIIRKAFKNVSELNDNNNHFEFHVIDGGFLQRKYRFNATLGSAGGNFKRQFTIRMPGDVTAASAGERRGNTVTWDCASGGAIALEASGLALPFDIPEQAGAIGIVLVIGFAALVVIHRRRAGAAAPPLQQQS